MVFYVEPTSNLKRNFFNIHKQIKRDDERYQGIVSLRKLMADGSPHYMQIAMQQGIFDTILDILCMPIDKRIIMEGIYILADVLSQSSNLAKQIGTDEKKLNNILRLVDDADVCIKENALIAIANIIAEDPINFNKQARTNINLKIKAYIQHALPPMPAISLVLLNLCSSRVSDILHFLMDDICHLLTYEDPAVLVNACSAFTFFVRDHFDFKSLLSHHVVERLIKILHFYKFDDRVAVPALKAIIHLSDDPTLLDHFIKGNILSDCFPVLPFSHLTEKYIVIFLSKISLGSTDQIAVLLAKEIPSKLLVFIGTNKNVEVKTTAAMLLCRILRRATTSDKVDLVYSQLVSGLIAFCGSNDIDLVIKVEVLKTIEILIRDSRPYLALSNFANDSSNEPVLNVLRRLEANADFPGHFASRILDVFHSY